MHAFQSNQLLLLHPTPPHPITEVCTVDKEEPACCTPFKLAERRFYFHFAKPWLVFLSVQLAACILCVLAAAKDLCISALHFARSPLPPPHANSPAPPLSMCRKSSLQFVCLCVHARSMDDDAICLSWELQGDWENGEGYQPLTTVMMQCPLPARLFTSLHLSLFPLPVFPSLSSQRWAACPACSVSFSAATTSAGKNSRKLTLSFPQDIVKGCFLSTLGFLQDQASKL